MLVLNLIGRFIIGYSRGISGLLMFEVEWMMERL